MRATRCQRTRTCRRCTNSPQTWVTGPSPRGLNPLRDERRARRCRHQVAGFSAISDA
jgi:hypothetical protein